MRSALLFSLTVLLAACGSEPPPPAAAAKPAEGRAETQGIRNTDALGMSGAAVADKLDATLKANEQRGEQLDSALEAQEKEQ